MKEDVLDNIAPADSVLLLDAGKEYMLIVLDDRRSFCMVYDVDLRDLLEACEDVAGDSLEGTIDLVLAVSRYNVRNKRRVDHFPLSS